MNIDEKKAYIRDWAAINKCVFQDKGEVGFFRPCVGITQGQSYVDYSWDDHIWTPENAYHKHDCLAVLIHPASWENITEEEYNVGIEELYEWVKWLNENDWTVTTDARKTYNEPGSFGAVLELIMGGITQARLVKA